MTTELFEFKREQLKLINDLLIINKRWCIIRNNPDRKNNQYQKVLWFATSKYQAYEEQLILSEYIEGVNDIRHIPFEKISKDMRHKIDKLINQFDKFGTMDYDIYEELEDILDTNENII